MRAVLVLALAACAHAAAPAVVPRPAPVPVQVKRSIWPVPVRVMTWTADGIMQVGTLPDAPPAAPPATPWFVEPVGELDAATFDRVIAAVRETGVPGLSLRGQPLAAARLDQLAELPALSALVLDDTAVADPSHLALALHRLYLARTAVDDAAIVRLVAAQPALEVLGVEDCAVGDVAAHAIAQLAPLRALDLAGTRLTDAGGAELGALAGLEILDVGRTAIGKRTIAALRGHALHELFVDATRVGREIATLAPLAPTLVRFDASNLAAYKPADADVAWLASAGNLVDVALSGASVHDKLVLALAQLPGLRVLRLAGTPITLASIRAIATRDSLEEVDLAATPVDDASGAALFALPKLRMLRLDRTPISDAAFAGSPGPALVELYVSRTAVGDAAIARLEPAAPRLVALGLGETHVGDATIERVARMPHLRTLVLSATAAHREVLAKLGALHELEQLYLDHTQADDTTVGAVAGARGLRVLHLEGTDLDDGGLAMLRELHGLRELTIGDTRVQALGDALDAWPELHTLSLLGLALGDDALAEVARHAQLDTLDLSSTDITTPAPLAEHARLRVLGLAHVRLSHDGEAAAARLARAGIEIVR